MYYTQLILNCELTSETPEEVINTLKFMLDNSSGSANYSIDKPLFKTDDWKYMIEGSTLQVNADGNFVLDITASIKDTEKQIPKFLN